MDHRRPISYRPRAARAIPITRRLRALRDELLRAGHDRAGLLVGDALLELRRAADRRRRTAA